MTIAEGQREMRTRYVGGFFGQLVSGVLWLVSASLAVWNSPRVAITTIVVGGVFIFPVTELLIRFTGARGSLSADNVLRHLGMQAAFVLPLSMPLLLPVGLYRLNWFFPALTILVGAHYLPFVTLYGMRMFAVLGAVLAGGGMMITMYGSEGFSTAAWFTGATLIVFAVVGKVIAERTRGSVA